MFHNMHSASVFQSSPPFQRKKKLSHAAVTLLKSYLLVFVIFQTWLTIFWLAEGLFYTEKNTGWTELFTSHNIFKLFWNGWAKTGTIIWTTCLEHGTVQTCCHWISLSLFNHCWNKWELTYKYIKSQHCCWCCSILQRAVYETLDLIRASS